jgi:hypothetical protein
MCEAIKVIDCPTWQNFIDDNPITNIESKKFIYRGQTNGEIRNNEGSLEFQEWKLISSFNRYYKSSQYKFSDFISQQISFIPSKYRDYKFVKQNKLDKANIISQIYFLQHYGIPTCFMDFTFHPFIALYFAISNIKGQSGGQYFNGCPKFYHSNYYFTVFKIDIIKLKEILIIKDLMHIDLGLWMEYEYYKIKIAPDINSFGNFALDIDPISKINNQDENYNITQQYPCFLMFDNRNCNGNFKEIDIEGFLNCFIKYHHLSIEEPIIYKYRIPYNSAFRWTHEYRDKNEPLFTFLRKNKCIGSNLFNDIQGIKYDFNFFHQEY